VLDTLAADVDAFDEAVRWPTRELRRVLLGRRWPIRDGAYRAPVTGPARWPIILQAPIRRPAFRHGRAR
jgi:hypothetical protein